MATTTLSNWRTTFTNATRIQQSFTADAERCALLWLAARTPQFINSDHLTALALIAQLAAGCGFALARWTKWGLALAIVAIVANWLGDSLDGTLARFRDQQRPRYGFYVDHVCDVFGATFLMLGLALSGFCDWRIALGMLIAFLILSAEVYLASYTLASFKMSYAKFGPTEIRVLLIAAIVRLTFTPYVHIAGHTLRLFDVGGIVAIAGMLTMAVFSAVVHTRRLYREETKPREAPARPHRDRSARLAILGLLLIGVVRVALGQEVQPQTPPHQPAQQPGTVEFWRVREGNDVVLVLGTGGECKGKVARRLDGELSVKVTGKDSVCGPRNALVSVRETNTHAVERAPRSAKNKTVLFGAAMAAGGGTGAIAAFVPLRGLFAVLGGGGTATRMLTKEGEKDKPGKGYVIYVSHLGA